MWHKEFGNEALDMTEQIQTRQEFVNEPDIHRMIMILKWISIGYVLGILVLAITLYLNEKSDPATTLNLIFMLFGLLVFYGIWRFRKYELSSYGIEKVKLVGAKMSFEWRDLIWKSGRMSLRQWCLACKSAGFVAKGSSLMWWRK